MNLDEQIRSEIAAAATKLFQYTGPLQIQPTNQGFEGSHTLVCFPLAKVSKKNPEETGRAIGEYLIANSNIFSRYNVVKGFLNLVASDAAWIEELTSVAKDPKFGVAPSNGKEIMVEYSSPNTNKPLHLGHLRNNFLGWSVAEIYKASGYDVHKVQIINDRGIHICKSMIAWKQYGNGETPESTGLKGDKLVGKYYVRFDQELKREIAGIIDQYIKQIDAGSTREVIGKEKYDGLIVIKGLRKELNEAIKDLDHKAISSLGESITSAVETAAKGTIKWKQVVRVLDDSASLEVGLVEQKRASLQGILAPVISIEERLDPVYSKVSDIVEPEASIMKGAQELLRMWEQKDPDTISLWKKMNGWVYAGFDVTYKTMGVDFDKLYYESQTYLLGKEEVLRGLNQGVFFKKEDGSVWVDLTSDGLDQKVLLRADGTSVYMTQDIGTAILRFRDFPKISRQVYTVGNEQEYHFKVLFLILGKLGYAWAKECYHLSYGMVDLPTGKMKSREGTVVDADDLMAEMIGVAEKQAKELGKIEDLAATELQKLSEMIGLGALKYFLLKVDPKKRMLFDPAESIQLQGHTGPFIQYTHARIRAILRKAEEMGIESFVPNGVKMLEPAELDVIRIIHDYPSKIVEAAREYSPSVIANYAYELAKQYNQFYQSIPIFNEGDSVKRQFRVGFSKVVADTLKKSMGLLGIGVPERM